MAVAVVAFTVHLFYSPCVVPVLFYHYLFICCSDDECCCVLTPGCGAGRLVWAVVLFQSTVVVPLGYRPTVFPEAVEVLPIVIDYSTRTTFLLLMVCALLYIAAFITICWEFDPGDLLRYLEVLSFLVLLQ